MALELPSVDKGQGGCRYWCPTLLPTSWIKIVRSALYRDLANEINLLSEALEIVAAIAGFLRSLVTSSVFLKMLGSVNKHLLQFPTPIVI